MFIKKYKSVFTPYFIGLILLAMSLPLSKYTTGLFHFYLVITFLFEGLKIKLKPEEKIKTSVSRINHLSSQFAKNLALKIKLIFRNRIALILISLYFIYALSIIHGGELNNILTPLRIKLPLLVLPLIIFSMPRLTKKQYEILSFGFVAAIIIATLFSAHALFSHSFTNIREISLFISPVRFGLMICFAICILVIKILKHEHNKTPIKFMFTVMTLWLIFILIKMESGIGMLILIALFFTFVTKLIFSYSSNIYKISLGILVLALPITIGLYINNEAEKFFDTGKINIEKIDQTTSKGNQYIHDTLNYLIEDGKYIGLYLCESELKSSWEKRSELQYFGLDKNGQDLRSTLIRYLTSKDLPKDEAGLQSLSNADIKHIENGIANANYVYNSGLSTRLSKIFFGYEVYLRTGNPNGNSLIQRSKYWATSVDIIKEHFWLGIGIGNTKNTFNNYFEKRNAKLTEKNKMESHNQYLLTFVILGFFGFTWFLFALVYPGIKTKAFSNKEYLSFFIIILLSMLTEDTLETQSGVTFFAFFNSILLSLSTPENKKLD